MHRFNGLTTLQTRCKDWIASVGATIRCPCQALQRTSVLNQECQYSPPARFRSPHQTGLNLGVGVNDHEAGNVGILYNALDVSETQLFVPFGEPYRSSTQAFDRLSGSWCERAAPRLCFGFLSEHALWQQAMQSSKAVWQGGWLGAL